MPKCQHCQRSERQHRAGKTRAGSQCKYTPEPKPQDYDREVRRVARHLGVHH